MKTLILLGVMAALFVGSANAQVADKDHVWATPGNATTYGMVNLCPNSSGLAVPCSTVPSAGSSAAGIPSGATPITGVGTGTTGAVTATLAGAAGKTTYVCNIAVSAAGTGAIGPVTLGTLIGGNSFTYQLTAPGNFQLTLTPCVPANAVNTAITATTTADASATAVDVNLSGYQF